MGAADHTAGTVHSATGNAGCAPERRRCRDRGRPGARSRRKTQGNPLAAGLIAFGAGLLVSSLIPASQKEREAADALKTAAEPLTTELTEAAKHVAEGLKEPAQAAMENVKATRCRRHRARQGRGPGRGRGRQGRGPPRPRTTSSRPDPARTRPADLRSRAGRPADALNPTKERFPWPKNPATAENGSMNDAETAGEQHRQGPHGARSGRCAQTGQPHRRHQTVVEVHREEDAAGIHQGPVPRPRRGPDVLLGPLYFPGAVGAGVPAGDFRASREDHHRAPGDRPGDSRPLRPWKRSASRSSSSAAPPPPDSPW